MQRVNDRDVQMRRADQAGPERVLMDQVEPRDVSMDRELVDHVVPDRVVEPRPGASSNAYSRRARALLFPIDWEEPFGLVMAEAMACGTPVIATPRGAVREVIEDGVTGFVVPVEGSAEAAAAALERIGQIDPKACRRRVEQRFTVERMLDGYEEAYRGVVSSSR